MAATLGQAVSAQALSGASARQAPEREVIGLQHQGMVRAVYQITGDEAIAGLNKGLLSLRELWLAYREFGVMPDKLDLRAVIHGPASTALLTDEAWSRVTGKPGPNPNTALLNELATLGVTVELCDVRRVRQGWPKSDIHPAVLLVSGAYTRLIDLQLQGYAYIRF